MSELKSEPVLKPIESAKPVAVSAALAAMDAMSEAEVKQLQYELERREKPDMPTWDEKKQAEVDAAARMARMSRVDFLDGQIRTSKTMDKAETDAATAKAAELIAGLGLADVTDWRLHDMGDGSFILQAKAGGEWIAKRIEGKAE